LLLTDPRDDKIRIEASKDNVLEGSCTWVFGDPAFVSWLDLDDCWTLWINGDPGKGKTMMVIDLISKLPERWNSNQESTLLSYFFCQNTVPELRSAVAVLRGLIYLLVVQRESLLRHVRKRYDDAGSRLFDGTNALYTLWGILSDISNDPSLTGICLMVDALDECEFDLNGLLTLITARDSSLSSRVKWLVTSRNHPAIEEYLRSDELHLNTSLELNSSHISCAVDAFVDFKVCELAKRKLYDSNLTNEVRDHLYKNAKGTFLWVSLVCKELEKVWRGHTRRILHEFPAGLEPLYERMLQQIKGQENLELSTFCERVLCAVVLSYRPLHLEEVVVIAGLPGYLSGDLPSLKDLVGRSGSFLTLRDETIYFVHQSVKDYFISGKGSTIFSSGHSEEHRSIMNRSLKIMSETLKRDICDLKMPGTLISELESGRVNMHLPRRIHYPCCYWIDHLREVYCLQQTQISERDASQTYEFLQRHFLHWLEALSLMGKMSEGVLMIIALQSVLEVSDIVPSCLDLA
jgi:hypothetical protein